ncbi:hypothetical protein JMJ35_005812 [Cladonia borealis]|uniref:Uncharacterized protein n=1 Tax=Cladonia borealis TaxID=184061 RepID=A0AA39QZR9_9LECA|nr:hypothetical protein JMJ35_005812 [Cladonia borealis]
MAAACLVRCKDDDTTVHLSIAYPYGHISRSLKSYDHKKLQIVPEESLNEEKPEERRFVFCSLCRLQRRHPRKSKFAIQKRTETRGVAFRERVERSKNSFKKRVSASKDILSRLGKPIQERFVKTVTKSRPVWGGKKGM